MCSHHWQNQPLTEIQIPERFKDEVLAYAQHLDAGQDKYIVQVKQTLDQQSNNYGDKFQEHLLEQYKVYLEMADRVSSRRLQTNGFWGFLHNPSKRYSSQSDDQDFLSFFGL